MLIKNLLFELVFVLITITASAQPIIEWQVALGGSDYDQGQCIEQTYDGGFIVAGNISSGNGNVTGFHGYIDYWVVKLSASGALEWQKTLGGSDDDSPYSICATIDSGYVVAGYTRSTDGDVTDNHGDRDAWVVKLNRTGEIVWQRALGGSSSDEAWSIERTSDGGFIMSGMSTSSDGDATGTHGYADYWVVKLNSMGDIEWQKALGGSDGDFAISCRETLDNGYVMTGEARSNDGDITDNNGDFDFWVVKLNSIGDIEWQNALGGSGWDVGSDIHETSDGFIACGYTGSNDGDVSGHQGLFDCWIVKLNTTGDLIWQKTLGGSNVDYARGMAPTNDGNFVVVGEVKSNDGDVEGNNGILVIWVLKINPSGELIWKKALGGTQGDGAYSIQQTTDGGYIIGGYAWSNDGDVTGNHGQSDFWVVKLAPETVSTQIEPPNPGISGHLDVFPNPANHSVILQIQSEETSLHVTISNQLGQEISRQTIPNGGHMDVTALANGVYLVAATTPSGKAYSCTLRKSE